MQLRRGHPSRLDPGLVDRPAFAAPEQRQPICERIERLGDAADSRVHRGAVEVQVRFRRKLAQLRLEHTIQAIGLELQLLPFRKTGEQGIDRLADLSLASCRRNAVACHGSPESRADRLCKCPPMACISSAQDVRVG